MKSYPSVEHVRACLRYEDGKLYWLPRPLEHFTQKNDCNPCRSWNTKYAGTEAGYRHEIAVKNRVHWFVTVDAVKMYRHVVVWALHHGEWVLGLDHKDRNPLNDRIENLRLATQSQNMANMTKPKNNTSGHKGVSWSKQKQKWIARIAVNKKVTHIGFFNEILAAQEAYIQAARQYFGEFACAGVSTARA